MAVACASRRWSRIVLAEGGDKLVMVALERHLLLYNIFTLLSKVLQSALTKSLSLGLSGITSLSLLLLRSSQMLSPHNTSQSSAPGWNYLTDTWSSFS